MCKGNIFNIQRFSTSDGPGIRTVVFLKGCPLDCAWCHNPESKSKRVELFYKKELCIGCGACADTCTNDGHTLTNGIHHFNRINCVNCGKCAKSCNVKALESCGEEKSAEEIINIVLRDKQFYDESGGGITISGGEPLFQYDFTLSLLTLAKAKNLHTAIETSGFSNKYLTELNTYTDLWLYDIKLFPEDEHIKHTGVSNKPIFENLNSLDHIGANIILRCPIIPDINFTENHFKNLVVLVNGLNNITEIHLEPYHPLVISKLERLGKMPVYKNNGFLDASLLEPFANDLRVKTNVKVIIL